MKKNLPVTENERRFPANVELVSATDTRGVVTHVNQDFVEISGFSRDELIGHSHNVVRHPDMPPAAFENMWSTLKSGRPWMGIVKNRCKNGDFYWVDAFVTPVLENGQVIGYESVRAVPEPQAVQRAERLYASLWKSAGAKSLPKLGLANRIAAGVSLVSGVLLSGAGWFLGADVGYIATAWALVTATAFLACHLGLKSLDLAAAEARRIVDNAVMQQVFTGRGDEVGNLQMAIKTLNAQVRTVLGRINESACSVAAESNELKLTAKSMNDTLATQQQEVDMIATSVEELSASVQEVANSAKAASQATEETHQRATRGHSVLREAITNTTRVASDVSRATDAIQALAKDSEAIGDVLVVIRSIAEQTNLLALNAAIEAARAGEQGRGFAVVADEVRTLAGRTQQSTEEIQLMIERLQSGTRTAVDAMQTGHAQVDSTVEQTRQVGSELEDIFANIDALQGMGRAIATAAEQQSVVASEISHNIHSLRDSAVSLTEDGRATGAVSDKVSREADELQSLITRFRS